ncbi:LINE-1 retrotransposable element ORF2 protein [Vitis vinifera]|uniref:LINE-1 retrotransposable element ORF2 protein n=1 Tax=Vitis vinifera TaxID=29760 RepID=A0A438BXW9_VITVI|nr:LINE-1 retrotransposable element ORF2 protein [Vitis vinifera]
MLLETEERIRFGCWLCWVVFGLYEDFKLEYERIRIQEEKEDSQKVFKYSKSRYCDASGNKEGNLGPRFVSSVWKGKRVEWAALPALYGPINPLWRKDFWLELQDLYGLTFPRWESGLLDPPLRNAAFTWSNMQADPYLFENMWLLHPEFKEKFRVWWQRVRVKGGKGETLNNIEDISEEIVNFFGNLYSKPVGGSQAVFQLNKEKAPGPDGFTIAVYQECWDVIKRGSYEGVSRVPHQWGNKPKYKCDLHCLVPKKRRLRKVLHETISDSQGAFVEGRHILDAVLIANEVVDEKRRSGEEGIVFKIDFEKAYDHVDWGFLDHVLQRKGFSQKWRSWIRGCLSSSSFAILVNGNAKGWVKASRGLRQGDPLSPFLFTLVADVLSRMLFRAEETGLTEGFSVGRDRTRVSLLQFADDTIFFSKASMEHLQNLKIILLVFGQVSGLKINLEKSTISGLPLGGNPKTIGFWDPVVERISRRLDGEGKKDHLVRWEVVSRPKELGGYRSIYGTHPNGWDANMVVRWSHRCPWKAIAQVFQEFSPFVRLVVGNGERIRFWEDLWWGNQSLCSQFADLYRVISVKNLTVSNVLGNSFPLAWNLNFRRNLTDSEIDLLQRLMSSLSSVRFSPSLADSRAWSLSSSGLFTVKSFFLALSKVSNPILFLPAKFLWSSKVPSKVKALAWIVAHGKVNTNDKLQLRRPYKSLCPQWCILCKGNGESIDHLFLHCPVTIGLWNKLFKLAGLDWVPPRSFEDMLVIAFKGLGNSLRGKTLWQVACLTLVWIVWQERNKRIFEDKGRSEETLWDLILFYSTLWASCSAAFRGVPLNVLQLNWSEVCASRV